MRSTQFVSRPSEAWTENAQALTTTTLFLVARVGPTRFTLKDEQDGTFKVTLGNPHVCTCGSQEDTCIHKLFCLIKVLRVPMEHVLCYQSSLTDSELDQVVDGIISQSSRRRPVRSRSIRAVPVVSEEAAKDTSVPRQPLVDGEDNACIICMDEMTSDQALTWCRVGCGQNIHAKCMMKCAQHNITNRLQITCPLCRNPMNLDTLKLDCKGKASLKHTYAPVQCSNCKCNQRGTFYRCVECSQASCGQQDATGKPHDFCPECFERQQDPTHRSHHFVRSDIVTEQSHGLEWSACKNPATRGVITNPELIRELQTRELGVNDYDLLLQLSDGGPTPDFSSLCVDSLPLFTKKSGKKVALKAQCWCTALASPSRIQSNIIVTSPITGEAQLTHLGAGTGVSGGLSPTRRNDGTAQGNSDNSPNRDSRLMRILPCRHVAHDRCLRDEISALVEDDSGRITSYRCSHLECGKKVFIGLSRGRRNRKSAEGTSTEASSKKVGGVTSHEHGQNVMGLTSAGVIGASCFGSTNHVAAGSMGASALRVNRAVHRRGRNSFGSGSDLSTISAGTLDLGVVGAATTAIDPTAGNQHHQHQNCRTETHPARPSQLGALPIPLLHMRSESCNSSNLLSDDISLSVNAIGRGRSNSYREVGAIGYGGAGGKGQRRPPMGRRVRLRALGDGLGGNGMLHRANTDPLAAMMNRDMSMSEMRELGSLSDRSPSPAPAQLPTISSHSHSHLNNNQNQNQNQGTSSLSSREMPVYGSAAGGSARGSLGSGRGLNSSARVSNVLLFNMSKQENHQQPNVRNRDRKGQTAHVADTDLMVASISLSNPSNNVMGNGGGGDMIGSTAAYGMQRENAATISRPSAGRIVRGLQSLANRDSVASMGLSGGLPTLG